MPNRPLTCSCTHHHHVASSILTPAERKAAAGPSTLVPGGYEICPRNYTADLKRRDQAARTKSAPKAQQRTKTMPKYRSETPDVDARLTALEKRMTALEKKLAPSDDGGEGGDARAPGVSYKSSRAAEMDRKMGIGASDRPTVRMEGTRQIFNAAATTRKPRRQGAA